MFSQYCVTAFRAKYVVRMGVLISCALMPTVAWRDVIAQDVDPPQPLISGVSVSLIAAEPEIVTPVSCRFDQHGNLFVVESHTHFPPDDYVGPKTDVIKCWVDTDGDRVPDTMHRFFDGTVKTMGLAIDENDWVYVLTRSELLRIRDDDQDGKAEVMESLVELDTKADYPHNGLGGICLLPGDRIVFGLGENFGEAYTVKGADGSRLRGGGEGGNVFSCNRHGGDLQWIATGFWNPFGITLDPHGRLIVAGNDPDAAPPNRLVHVVPGGDYGFQFRYGRSGIHPLQAWNRELPGTLPRISGTGEAACAVLPFRNRLWVTSWGDNRLETHAVSTDGASVKAEPEVVIVGSAEFRPVDMAVGPDGALYVTDWVDRSYPVHGRGRIWRFEFSSDSFPAPAIAALSDQEVLADRIRNGDASESEIDEALAADDPFLCQAVVSWLSQSETLASQLPSEPSRALATLSAWRWRDLTQQQAPDEEVRAQILKSALSRNKVELKLMAIRWIAEQGLKQWSSAVSDILTMQDVPPQIVGPAVACLAFLEGENIGRSPIVGRPAALLADLVKNPKVNSEARPVALRMLPADASDLDDQAWHRLLNDEDAQVVREAVRIIAGKAADEKYAEWLHALVASDSVDVEARLDAAWMLALAQRKQGATSFAKTELAMRELVQSLVPELGAGDVLAERVDSMVEAYESDQRPGEGQLTQWLAEVGIGGDANRGWRVFQAQQCADCHAVHGRGSRVGPELTGIGRSQSREQLLLSILEPSRDIAPLYSAWSILTTDGRVLRGIKLNGGGVDSTYRYLDSNGEEFSLKFNEIETQKPAEESLMPKGLHEKMSVEALRDLLAFLSEDTDGERR